MNATDRSSLFEAARRLRWLARDLEEQRLVLNMRPHDNEAMKRVYSRLLSEAEQLWTLSMTRGDRR